MFVAMVISTNKHQVLLWFLKPTVPTEPPNPHNPNTTSGTRKKSVASPSCC